MIDPSTTLAVVIATMLLLIVVLGVGRGEYLPRCPICGGAGSAKHAEDCPWSAQQDEE